MKTVAIIAEYNPFHNGHKYQIDKLKNDNSRVIAIMSGSFVQRGDIAVFDKWTRARAAIENGCDLVLELPVCYSLNSAKNFAYGAVSILNKLNVIDTLCFGAECDDMQRLSDLADLILNESIEIKKRIKEYNALGYSFPRALSKAYDGVIDTSVLEKPNNILAIEYIMALKKLNSDISPFLIQRKGSEHDSFTNSDGIASASYIRKLIQNKADFSEFVPASAYEVYKNADIYNISSLDTLICGYLRLMKGDDLERINDVSEGLHNRIKHSADTHTSFYDIAMGAKSKRYTLSRIRRVILSALLGFCKAQDINYIRPLAMNTTGKAILKEIKEKSSISIITKASAYNQEDAMFSLDIKATDIFALANNKKSGLDFLTSPVIADK